MAVAPQPWGRGSNPELYNGPLIYPMPLSEKIKIIRYQIFITERHHIIVPPILQWIDYERDHFINSSPDIRRSMIQRMECDARRLRRRLGDLTGLGKWLARQLATNPSRHTLLYCLIDSFECEYGSIYPDQRSFIFIKKLNRLRFSRNLLIRRSTRFEQNRHRRNN
jgi:hypothetical protein